MRDTQIAVFLTNQATMVNKTNSLLQFVVIDDKRYRYNLRMYSKQNMKPKCSNNVDVGVVTIYNGANISICYSFK